MCFLSFKDVNIFATANMETDKVISALNSELRREILKIISKEPMPVIQVLEELKKKGYTVKYRSPFIGP
jgi:DNA-binding transcriptional ArsR family regulator